MHNALNSYCLQPVRRCMLCLAGRPARRAPAQGMQHGSLIEWLWEAGRAAPRTFVRRERPTPWLRAVLLKTASMHSALVLGPSSLRGIICRFCRRRQRASWIELGSCSWLFCIVRFPCLLLLSGWLLAGSELPDEGILHRAIEPLDRPSSLAAGQLGACFWIAAVCIFSP